MRNYIKKLLSFTIFVIIVIVLITISNKVLLSTINPFKVDNKKHILIVGDSHTKYAFNDNILSNTCNFSDDADSYFYTFIKVKRIIEVNPHIDTVFISFSNHNINKSIEDRWLFNKKHLNSKLKLYFPLLTKQDFIFFSKVAPTELISSSFRQVLFPLYIIKRKVFGGYEDLDHNILKGELEKLENNNKEQDSVFEEAKIEEKYLRETISLCKKYNIIVILINPPLHKSLNSKQEFLYKCYVKNFSDVLFYDFSKLELKDEYFGDLVHLSPSGAEYLSTLIKEEYLFNIDKARTHNILYK